MALHLHTAATLAPLATAFGVAYQEHTSIFKPMNVVIGSTTTKEWLKETIATEKGIVANIAFFDTTEFLKRLSKILDIQVLIELNSVQTNWQLFEGLQTAVFKAKFPDIAAYYGENALKRFTLATEITVLFEKYRDLEPSLLHKWRSSTYEPENKSEEWQCYLWQYLIHLENKTGDFGSELLRECLKSIENQTALKEKLPSISFFGSIEYTKELLSILEIVATYITVNIYKIDYFRATDFNNTNRLIQNFGNYEKTQYQLTQHLETTHLQTTEFENKSLLNGLKNYILTNKEVQKYAVDTSIKISNCFSINREVEVLYQYLVQQFEENPKLNARDIVVMLPNTSDYAPAIAAFFKSSKYEIKYTLFETNLNVEESPFSALLALFEIEQDHFTAEEVLKLLDFTALRQKFQFNEATTILRSAVSLANIKHGFDGKKEIETDLVSWRYGLKRLVYGICMKDEILYNDQENTAFYTVPNFEGADATEIIRLNYFVEQLIVFLEERDQSKTSAEWIHFIIGLIENFLDTTTYDFSYFISKLSKINTNSEENHTEIIPFSVMHHFIKGIISDLQPISKTGFSGVRFTTWQHKAVVPAKIIAFLGMNGSSFPRNSTPLSFDLAATARTQTDLDKHLFLSSILAASDTIYISYVGQNINDNSSIPPSTVLEELLDTLKQLTTNTNSIHTLITKHPLHGFSTLYNNDPQYVRYFTTDIPIVIQKKTSEETSIISSDIIQIEAIYPFFYDSIKWYYNKILGIYYNQEDLKVAERELFELDTLQNWNLKTKLLHLNNLETQTLEAFRGEYTKKGLLPLSNSAAVKISNLAAEIEALKAEYITFTTENASEFKIENLRIGKYTLKGIIPSIYGENIVFATVSKNKEKYQFKAFLYYLVLIASGTPKNLIYLAIDTASPIKIAATAFTEKEAQAILEKWLSYFERGQHKIVAFSLEFGTIKIDLSKDEEAIIKSFRAAVGKIKYLSEYQNKEIENGFFENVEKCKEYLEIYKEINEQFSPYFKN